MTIAITHTLLLRSCDFRSLSHSFTSSQFLVALDALKCGAEFVRESVLVREQRICNNSGGNGFLAMEGRAKNG